WRSTASCSCRRRIIARPTGNFRWSWWCRAAWASPPRTLRMPKRCPTTALRRSCSTVLSPRAPRGLTPAPPRFPDAVVADGAGFRSVLAAYPWSGHQFLDPSVDEPEIRIIMGDADEWCSPMQVQGHREAITLSGGRVTMRLIGGAQHSFDRGTGIENVPDASVSPAAPTAYIANNGAFIHPLHGVA